MNEVTDKDAVELLDADHIAVKHLFVEYARMVYAEPDEAGERRAIALRICDDITLHAQIEEEIFYPALRRAAPDDADLLDEAESEHQEAKSLIAAIRAEQQAGEAMDDLVAKLAQAIEHHVKEERDYLFPKARARLDLAQLGEEMRARQQQGQAPQNKKRPAGR